MPIKTKTALDALAQLEAEIEGLNRRRKELPERVLLSTVGERHTLHLQQKAIIDLIKITAYNAEEMLLELLAVHFSNLHDNPTHRRALRGLCADLNKLALTYPGTELPLRYNVGVHLSPAIPDDHVWGLVRHSC